MVNGHAIHEEDVVAYVRAASHDDQDTLARRKNALEVIIQKELAAQKATELGLDGSDAYKAKLRILQAQVDDLRRKELSEAYYRLQAKQASSSTDAEATAYFEANKAQIQTDVHVLQILRRSRAEIDEVEAELKKGMSFQEIAERPFLKLPQGATRPWDLGFLKWSQVPEPWQDVVYDMAPGAVSEVLTGTNGRFWIIQLVEKKTDPDVTLEVMKPVLNALLADRRQEAARADLDKTLRGGATVEYMNPALLAPKAPAATPRPHEEE